MVLFLLERRLLPSPLLYLSAFFEATRRDYYDLLLGVSRKGDWNSWIEYFLRGVARQAEDAVSRAERINGLLDLWRQTLAGSPSKAVPALIDLLGENPYWTIRGVAERLGLAYTTAQRAMQELETGAILTPLTDAKRDRVYCAKAILDILEEPANLVPQSR